MKTDTREMLESITKIYLKRLKELEEIVKVDGITKEVNAELRSIMAHCLSVEKLYIEEASKLASALPGFKERLAKAKVGGSNE